MLKLSLAPSPCRSAIPPHSSFLGAKLPAAAATAPIGRGKSALRAGKVIMMAKREEELKGIREMTTDQINEEVIDLKGELFMLRLQKSARNEFKNSEFGRMRKRV